MNKILKNSFIIPVLLTGTLLFACTNDGVTPVDEVNPVVIPENVAAGTTVFAFYFFQKFYRKPSLLTKIYSCCL